MPNAVVAIWNVQNYGRASGERASTFRWGVDSALRNRFLVAFIENNGIDLLLLLEPASTAWPSLVDLQAKLNAGANNDWAASLCGSAVGAGGPVPPTALGHMTFLTGARSEGYAVLWRTNTGRFTVLPAVQNVASNSQGPAAAALVSPLYLSTAGRVAGGDEVAVGLHSGTKRARELLEQDYTALGGYVYGDHYPYDETGEVMDEWPDLKLPTTGKVTGRDVDVTGVRRPAYVVLDLGDAGLCPVAGYHAPSNKWKAGWGARLSGLSREMFVARRLVGGILGPLTDCDRVVFAGDFNYQEGADDWPGEYGFFTNAYGDKSIAGAGCRVAPAQADSPDRKTTVQLLEHDHVTPRSGLLADDYLSLAIDLVFYRGGRGAGAVRPELVGTLMGDAAPPAPSTYGAVLQAIYAHLQIEMLSVGGPTVPPTRMDPSAGGGVGPQQWDYEKAKWIPIINGAWGGSFTSWNLFMNKLQAGRLDTARQAAEFIHLFVSDHLPLVATLSY